MSLPIKNISSLLPAYLRDIKPKRDFLPPTTSKNQCLPFNQLSPEEFERLCCDFIHKRYARGVSDEVDSFVVEPILGSGHKQYGADIFVRVRIGEEFIHELYEVKRIDAFSWGDCKEAIARFLRSHKKWEGVSKFVIMSAHKLTAAEIIEWKKNAVELSDVGVEFDVISANRLNDEIKDYYPELIVKYFNPAWLEVLFDKNTKLYFEEFGYWEFYESSSWIEYSGPSESLYDNVYTYQNDHVKILAYLPDKRSNSASCLVELRNGRFSHVTITLSHSALVGKYFHGCRTPLISEQRSYLMRYLGKPDNWVCDLGNCRIVISGQEAQSVCEAFDHLFLKYKDIVADIEEEHGSHNFQTISGLNDLVPLIEIKRGLWDLICIFAEEHDAFDTEGEWSLFDSSGSGMLKVYSKGRRDDLEPGYHAMLKAIHADNWHSGYRTPDNDVILAWSPPSFFSMTENTINPRNFWSAEVCHDWLVDDLIPYVIAWNEIRRFQSQWGLKRLIKKRPSMDILVKNFKPDRYLSSFRTESKANSDQIISTVELLIFVEQLQSFFHATNSVSALKECEYKDLFTALFITVKYTVEPCFSYLHGNTNYLECHDIPSFLSAVEARIDSHAGYFSGNKHIDCVLRCILVCLRDFDTRLNSKDIVQIVKLLKPLEKIMIENQLLFRQSHRLETVSR